MLFDAGEPIFSQLLQTTDLVIFGLRLFLGIESSLFTSICLHVLKSSHSLYVQVVHRRHVIVRSAMPLNINSHGFKGLHLVQIAIDFEQLCLLLLEEPHQGVWLVGIVIVGNIVGLVPLIDSSLHVLLKVMSSSENMLREDLGLGLQLVVVTSQ